jgi:hypothetical protein
MTSRERARLALNHQQPDRVPIDFGSTVVSGISAGAIYNLRRVLGLKERTIKITEPYQMLGEVDDELKKYLKVDFACINAPSNLFGYDNDNYKPWTMFDGTPVLVPDKFNTMPDSNGDILMYPEGDKNVAPSARMPKGGYYFDAIIRQEFFDEDNLNVEDNLEEFSILDEKTLRYIETQTDNLYRNTDYSIVANMSGSALGDIAIVPATMLKFPKGIRDIEEWYISTVIRQDYIKEIFDKQTDITLKNLEMYKEAVGDKIDVIFLCGTDLGTQTSTFCSPEVFRDLYMPFYQKMTGWIHKNTTWKIFKHCCGAIEPLIDSLIDAGFDILNPVQCSCHNMDPTMLKEKYGDKLIFWGGGVDTQKTLPFGTEKEVLDEIKSRIDIFNRNGGYVFNTIHNVQSDVPAENLLAIVNAIHGLTGE